MRNIASTRVWVGSALAILVLATCALAQFFNDVLGPEHVGANNPVDEGFVPVGRSGPPGGGPVEIDGEPFWQMTVNAIQRFKTDTPPIEGDFVFTIRGALQFLQHGHGEPGNNPEDLGVTGLAVTIDTVANRDAVYNLRWNEQLTRVMTLIPEEEPFAPFFELDATQVHTYQIIRKDWVADLWVDGVKVLEELYDHRRGTGFDNHTGLFVGGVGGPSESQSIASWDIIKLEVPRAFRADFDMDGDVDFEDFSVLAFNFTGTCEPGICGFEPDEGDTDDDEDVDFDDFSRLAFEFTGTITSPAGGTPDTEGDVHLEIDLTRDGTMTLQPNNANLAGYSIRSSDSQIVLDADNLATPFLFYLLNASHEVTAGSVGATTMLTEDLPLDIRFEGTFDEASNNVVFQYTRAGEVTPVDGVVHVIPEPATLILAATGLLVMPRRRRSA